MFSVIGWWNNLTSFPLKHLLVNGLSRKTTVFIPWLPPPTLPRSIWRSMSLEAFKVFSRFRSCDANIPRDKAEVASWFSESRLLSLFVFRSSPMPFPAFTQFFHLAPLMHTARKCRILRLDAVAQRPSNLNTHQNLEAKGRTLDPTSIVSEAVGPCEVEILRF